MKLYQLFVAMLILASCNKRKCGETEANALIGHWEWIQSSGGISGGVSTPSSTGKVVFLDIFDDETYKLIENNQVIKQGNLKLKEQHCMHSNVTKSSLELGTAQRLTIESMTTTQLVLGEEMADGMQFEYTR